MSEEDKKIKPYIFGGLVLLVALFVAIQFNDSYCKAGTLGDLFNGVLGPFIALVSAILIYRSFNAQLNANLLISSQWEFDKLSSQLELVNSGINQLHIESFRNNPSQGPMIPTQYIGTDAIKEFINRMDIFQNQKNVTMLSDLAFVLEDLRALIDDIRRSKLDKESKGYLYKRIARLYVTKLEIPLNQINEKLMGKQFVYHLSVFKAIDESINLMRRNIAFDTELTETEW